MFSINFFIFFIPLLAVILITVNILFAPHMPYKEKKTPFECGIHSFLSQNRIQVTILYIMYTFLFILLDLEIVLLYPYSVSSSSNQFYGLIIMLLFTIIVTIGFAYELGKNALKIVSRQDDNYSTQNNYFGPISVLNKKSISTHICIYIYQINYKCFTS